MIGKQKDKSVKELKKIYERLQKKFNLPNFSELNELFDIEEISFETDFLLRRIRRTIIEKISIYFRLVEVILNPSTAPLFFFRKIKKLAQMDRDLLSSNYETIGNLEAEAIILDLRYSEEKEAEFIKKIFSTFNIIKKDISKIIEILITEKNNETRETKGSYLG